eukprot:CAMPEP_0119331506 /NCGR_PEP_ID=MMETSP1333-20130426/80716_1 /TAXON_ID=418940 /ORGANISM="Scyphosphaera apsteinii, Strain RCC1455" /LENGTH=449 /DNA_ID=CAMNT_0007341123 /DNA_START=245 /DNA_END=1594 /DNA_ORIENTATION=-
MAAAVAWIMQEGAARLTLASGFTLSECIFKLAPRGMPAALRLLLVGCTLVVSLASECNNMIGVVSVIDLFDVSSSTTLSTTLSVLLVPLSVALLLASGKSMQSIGIVLSFFVFLMILCFSATMAHLPATSIEDLMAGLLPHIPAGAAPLALSLVGTTCVPLNLLLGSSMAKGSSLRRAQEGIALSSALTAIISLLLMLVASSAPTSRPTGATFKIQHIIAPLTDVIGEGGRIGFALGLAGAGLSSALATPLATAIALHDLLGCSSCVSDDNSHDRSMLQHTNKPWRKYGRQIFMSLVIGVGVLPAAMNMPAITVILVAAFANGLLLPLVSSCLFLCLNHPRLMRGQPQSTFANILLVPCIGLSFLLAGVAFTKQIAHSWPLSAVLQIAGFLGAFVLLLLLASIIWKRWHACKRRHNHLNSWTQPHTLNQAARMPTSPLDEVHKRSPHLK